MRILHIVTAFPRHEGDVIAPWLVELLKRLQAAGHDVEVFCSAYRGGGGALYEGIPVHRFRYFPARWEDLTHDEAAPDRMRRSWRYQLMPAFYVAGGMLAVWRLCRRRRYDVVHVHWPMPHALFGAVARATCGARLVTLWYGVELRWVQGSLPWLRWLVRWALNTSDQVVAISSYTAREIKRVSDVPVRVIPYTVGLPTVAPPSPAARRDGGFRVLFVGRLVERKGVAELIEGVRRLSPTLDVRLDVIGDGPERARLEALVREGGLGDRVTLRGRVSAAELRAAYGAADAFALPSILDSRSDTEGLGVVLLEAMSYGVPVIGSDIGGIPDIIVDGETGLLVPPGNPAALAAALRRLAAERGLAVRLGSAGREHVRNDFSWESIVAQWEECYAAAKT
ncbi:MAG TPA: glycosyltransferase family 4 protein [Gemmatimonadales bacterium]|nr:glycosyltransferase family 4 protein [Gemmatimonadales bacterium]